MPDAIGAAAHKRPSLEAIYAWFNAWLEHPLNDREKVLISEVFHCIDYPEDVARYEAAISGGDDGG